MQNLSAAHVPFSVPSPTEWSAFVHPKIDMDRINTFYKLVVILVTKVICIHIYIYI